MALSMTGCGEGVATDGPSTCRVELRCVNNRFLKLSLRSREGFSTLESQIEAAIRRRVRRGAVQMTLDVTGPAAPAARTLDQAQLEAYLGQLEHFCARHDLPVPKSIDGLLGLPGILAESLPSKEAIERTWPLVARALDTALDGLDAMRRAEGNAMARDMRETCRTIVALVASIRSRVPAVLEEHRARLHERVGKLLESRGATLAEADLAREIALVAERSDIAEELVRLESHIGQFDRLLEEESPGRSLDFLTQELAREANTIASKSLDVGIAHAVVELKTQIERLRELVQNVE
jgi:uncharacterized protein (TIGR00255 family)